MKLREDSPIVSLCFQPGVHFPLFQQITGNQHIFNFQLQVLPRLKAHAFTKTVYITKIQRLEQ